MAFGGKYALLAAKLSLGVALCLYAIYTFPFFKNFSVDSGVRDLMTDSNDGLYQPLFRSIIFSVGTALVVIFLSLLISYALKNISVSGIRGKWLSLLLLPIVLGNVSTSFIWKLVLLDFSLPFSTEGLKFLTLTFIHFWQYGTLFIYLFWMNQQLADKKAHVYADVSGFNQLERWRDIVLPRQRNLMLLLYIISTITFYYEDAKIQFIFKSSRGTNTELVNQWLYRLYQSDNLLSPDYAFEHISQMGLLVLIFGCLTLIITLYAVDTIYVLAIRSRVILPGLKLPKMLLSILYYLIILFTLGPVIVVFYLQPIQFDQLFAALWYPFLLTSVAALLATILAIVFSVINRLALKEVLNTFNQRSMYFIIALFLLTLIPPIVILIVSFQWMQTVGYTSQSGIYSSWIIGHIFLAFPLLAGFLVTAHFRLPNNHISYMKIHRISLQEQFKHLFMIPFAADYLLTFIVALSLIWNESVVNNVLSDIVPSFVAELNKTITGKDVNYALGMNYLMVSLVLGGLSVVLWNSIVNKGLNKHR
jgi:ABC-type sugar transport system permease subunit